MMQYTLLLLHHKNEVFKYNVQHNKVVQHDSM